MKASLGLGGYFVNPEDNPEKIIHHAIENGITTFDTSPAYGDSEKWFGNVLSQYNRYSYILMTKTKAKTKTELYDSILNSANNLKTQTIDVLFGHSFIDDMETLKTHLEVLEEMNSFKKCGFVYHIGVSGHSVEAAMYVLKNNLVDYIMIPHSIMYVKFNEVIEKANWKDVRVVTMKNFGSGILLGGPNNNNFKENITLQNIMDFSIWSGADTIIPAARSIKQLDEIIECYKKTNELTFRQELKLTNKITEILGDNFCRFCNECRPCPKYGWMMSQPGILKSMLYHENFNSDMKETYFKYKLNIKDCKDCNSECNKMCPFGIDIKEQMKKAHNLFTGGNI